MPSELNLESFEDTLGRDVDTPSLAPNVAAMRRDIARITSDMQGGEELYRQTLLRIESLMQHAEKAELDVSVLNRIEPENRDLKSRLRIVQDELEETKDKLSLITAYLEDHQERLDEKTTQHNQMRRKLITATKRLQDYAKALKRAQSNIKQQGVTVDQNKTELTVETRENKILRQKVSKLSEIASLKQKAYLESSKTVKNLRLDFEEQREQAEHYRSEAQDLRILLNSAKRQNNAIKGKMLALHDEIKTLKTQYELSVIGQEDQISDLQVQFTNQLGLKNTNLASEINDTDFKASDDIAHTELESRISHLTQKLDAQELAMAYMRDDKAAQLKENEQLKNFIESQTAQLEAAETALLDQRYDTVEKELSAHHQKSLSQSSAKTPDIELALQDEDVEQRILQYKFGTNS